MASFLDNAIKRITVETTWLAPMVLNRPFEPAPPGQTGIAAVLKPRITIESDYSAPVVLRPYGNPTQNWPYVKLIVGVAGIGALVYALRRSVKHRRAKSGLSGLGAVNGRRIRKGTKVMFAPDSVSYALYSNPPRPGATGTVTDMNVGSGKRRTFLPGPGGGLVYVKWDNGDTQGVSQNDLEKR